MSQGKEVLKVTLDELLRYLSIKESEIEFLRKTSERENQYLEFQIPKKNGGLRQIAAPSAYLKGIQKRLLAFLCSMIRSHQHSIEEDQDIPAHIFPTNFINASRHLNKRFVFNCDISDFFESIKSDRVVSDLIKWPVASFPEDVAQVISLITCYKGSLPQGGPCSPILAHICAYTLDEKLGNLATLHDCTYTRYVDDITFSTNAVSFPEEIGRVVRRKGKNKWRVGPMLTREAASEDFSFNPLKTRMYKPNTRQEVTGLTVNTIALSSRKYRHYARAMTHRLFTTGSYLARTQESLDNGCETSSLNILHGILSYIFYIDSCSDGKMSANRAELYCRFLVYRYFYSSSASLIVSDQWQYEHNIVGASQLLQSVGHEECIVSLLAQDKQFKNFRMSRHQYLAFGRGGKSLKIGDMLSKVIRSYSSYAVKRTSKGEHLFVFDNKENYDAWAIEYMSDRLAETYEWRDGRIGNTNIYVSYHLYHNSDSNERLQFS